MKPSVADHWRRIFRQRWTELEQLGKCDALDGQEYQRLYALWVKNDRPCPIKPWIEREANRPARRARA